MVSTQETLDRRSTLTVREKLARPTHPHMVRADQVVHAWSLGGGKVHARPEVVVQITTNEECPPEVYIG